MSICVHELALGCTLKTPLFLAVRLPNRQIFSRASARFDPPAAARKGNLHITKGSPPLNLASGARRLQTHWPSASPAFRRRRSGLQSLRVRRSVAGARSEVIAGSLRSARVASLRVSSPTRSPVSLTECRAPPPKA
eukprot:scaffold63790_cov70-Phaeocystis_antarctica.AAC.1